jgi:hypothetical protein|tara:strand:+ start:331 stop:705 length:375 start_codon:yes stop_codon:yes gene_type:complete
MAYSKQYQNRGNKYKAIKQKFNGRTYHSKKEAAYAAQLELRKLAGEIKHIKPQHRLQLYVEGKLICNYYIDFKVTNFDNTTELIEVKGFETDLWRLKWKLTESLLYAGKIEGEHPDTTSLILVK